MKLIITRQTSNRLGPAVSGLIVKPFKPTVCAKEAARLLERNKSKSRLLRLSYAEPSPMIGDYQGPVCDGSRPLGTQQKLPSSENALQSCTRKRRENYSTSNPFQISVPATDDCDLKSACVYFNELSQEKFDLFKTNRGIRASHPQDCVNHGRDTFDTSHARKLYERIQHTRMYGCSFSTSSKTFGHGCSQSVLITEGCNAHPFLCSNRTWDNLFGSVLDGLHLKMLTSLNIPTPILETDTKQGFFQSYESAMRSALLMTNATIGCCLCKGFLGATTLQMENEKVIVPHVTKVCEDGEH